MMDVGVVRVAMRKPRMSVPDQEQRKRPPGCVVLGRLRPPHYYVGEQYLAHIRQVPRLRGCQCRSIKRAFVNVVCLLRPLASPLALPHFDLDRVFRRPMRPDHPVIKDV